MVGRTLLAVSACAFFFLFLPSCNAELADCTAVTGGLPYKCLHDLPLTDPVQFYYKFYWQTDRVMFEFRVPSAKGWIAIVFAKPGGTPADLIGADAIVGRVMKTPVEVREIGVFRIASLRPDNTPNLADMVPLADPAWLVNPRSTDTYTSEFFSYLQLKVQRQRVGGAHPIPVDPFSTVHFLYHPTDDDYAVATGIIHHKFDVPWLRTPGGTQAQTAVPKPAPPTDAPTDAPPTDAPPTDAPPTDAPPTKAPPTNAPPTPAPPTPAPPTPAPPTPAPPTAAPPTAAPPTASPPTPVPPTPAPPTLAPAPAPPMATPAPPPTAAPAAPTLAPTPASTEAPTAAPTAVPATAEPATSAPVTDAPTLAPSSPLPATDAPYERPPLHFVVASSAARYSEVREGVRRFYRELYGADRETARRRVTQAEWVPATSRVVEEVSVNADAVVARSPETPADDADAGGATKPDGDTGGSVARVLALNAESAGGGGGGGGAPRDVMLPLRVVTKEELRAEDLRNETFHGVSLVAQTETHLLHTLVARGQVVATARMTSEELQVEVSDTETRTVTLYAISLAFHYPDVGGDAQTRAASATATAPAGGVPPAVYSTEEGEERLVAYLHNTEGWLFRDVGCLTDRCEMVRIRVRRDTGSIGFSDGERRLRTALQGAGFAAVAAAAALFAGSGGAAVLGHHSPAKMVRAALVPKVLECPVNRPNDLEYALRPVPLGGRYVAPGSPDEQYADAAVYGAAAFCAAGLLLAVVFLAKQRLAAGRAGRAVAPSSPASSGSLNSPASAAGLVSVPPPPPPPPPRGGCGSLFARARRSLLLQLLKASFFHCLFGVAVFLYGSVSLGGLVFAVYGDSDGVRVACAAALLAAQALPLYVYTVHAALPGMAVKVDRRSLFGPSSARYRDAAAEHEAAAAAEAAAGGGGGKPPLPREGLWERVRLFFVGREYWLETEEAGRSWVELHRPVFHHLTLAGRRFPLIELLQVAVSVGVTAWRPSVHPGCIARGTLLSVLPLALMVFLIVRRPYEATYQNVAEAALCGLECAALCFGWTSMALGERRPSAHWTATVARFLANLLTACVVGKACVDALVFFLARREEAGFEALRRQSLEEMQPWEDPPVEAEAYARADARETRRDTVYGRACREESLRQTRGPVE